MENIGNVFLQLFNATMSIISFNYFISAFAEKKANRGYLSAVSLVCFFLTSLLVTSLVPRLVLLLSCIFLLTLGYEMKYFFRALLTVLSVVLSSLLELIVALVIIKVMSADFNEVTGTTNFIGILLSKFVEFLLYFTLKMKKRVTYLKFRKDWLGVYLLPFVILAVHFIVYYSMKFYSDNQPLVTLSFVCLALLILSSIFILNLIDKINRSVIKEHQLTVSEQLIKEQEQQYRLLFADNERIVKLRHDHKNLVIGILSELEAGNIESVKNTLTAQLEALKEGDSGVICGNGVIDAIIGYKRSIAKSRGVTLSFEYKNIHSLSISPIDLSILIGNAIDNAIEAAERLSEDRTVHVFIHSNGRQVVIGVKNNVESNFNAEELETTKDDKLFHGYGILNMKQIAKKYNGTVSLKCEDRVFNTVMILTDRAE